MKIAIVSDIHDNVWTLQAALTRLHNADILICCGDLCSPFILSLMAEGFSGPIHIVEGNNEGDWRRITQQAAKYSHVHLYGEYFQEEIDGKRIAVNHYPDIALPIAQSGKYDLVCYGHNHRFAIEQRGSTLTLNPGTLLGYDPVSRRDVPATFIVYETLSNEALGYQVLTKMTVDALDQSTAPYPEGPFSNKHSINLDRLVRSGRVLMFSWCPTQGAATVLEVRQLLLFLELWQFPIAQLLSPHPPLSPAAVHLIYFMNARRV